MAERTDKETTKIGYVNCNQQKNLGRTHPPRTGSDHLQYVYVMLCLNCGKLYGANGSDIFERKCPSCQNGAEGLPLYSDDFDKITMSHKQ